jgi:DNA-binding NarL/FixJ family response regulator
VDQHFSPPAARGDPARVVVLIDRQPIVLEAVARAIAGSPRHELSAASGCGDDAVRLLCEHRPDVALIDPGRGSIASARLEAVHHHCPQTPVVVISMDDGSAMQHEASRCGARGFLSSWETDEQRLLRALTLVAEGQSF